MTNAVGRWNPAWGPEPVKANHPKNDWHHIRCPKKECQNHGGALVYAPIQSDGSRPAEKYCCALCGTLMRATRVKHGAPAS